MNQTDLPDNALPDILAAATEAHAGGRMEEARSLCQRILDIDPAHGEALNLTGVICCQLGDPEAGIVFLAKACASAPDNAGFLNNLGTGLSAIDRDGDALLTYTRALELDPSHATTHNNIATIYRNRGQLSKASEHYRRALDLRSDYAEAESNFGNVLLDLGRLDEASEVLEKAIVHNPDYAFAYNNLGIVRQRQGRYSEAERVLLKAIALAPDFADPYANMAEILKETGRAEEAVAYYQKSLTLAPDQASLRSNYVYALHNLDTLTPAAVFDAHQQWGQHHTPAQVPPASARSGRRRKLRVGYVSADLRQHSVSYFLAPLLTHHDRDRFEIYAYSAGHIEDQVTDRLRRLCDQWRSIYMMPDQQALEMIRADGIDILVDLSGHTMGNRLTLFAHKPAPVQVTYLGYPATTGLPAMDYRLSDQWADPQGMTEAYHTEQLVRIEGGFLCYQPPQDAPEIMPRPSLKNGYVTFGSCNNLAKLTPRVLALWADILRAVPDARLLLKGKALADEAVRARYLARFADWGVEAGRLDLRAWISGTSHLAIYNHMDIALDPFPYNGTTTICETLWMGVPTVVLAGDCHAARVGLSLAASAGVAELVADDLDGYRQLAINLATDFNRLDQYRTSLRPTLSGSRLCDGPAFTRAYEQALASMVPVDGL